VQKVAGAGKLIYAHWALAMNGGTGAFTGRDYQSAQPFGPTSGFADANAATQYVQDVATGKVTDANVALDGTGGIIGAVLVKAGNAFYPVQVNGSLVGAPGRAHDGQVLSTEMTANADTTFNYAGGEQTLSAGQSSFTPWGYKSYSSDVADLVVADSKGDVAHVNSEGAAHWWNTPKTGMFGL
jgi:hypothetical protein